MARPHRDRHPCEGCRWLLKEEGKAFCFVETKRYHGGEEIQFTISETYEICEEYEEEGDRKNEL